jgi:hypothetical protein
MSLCALLTFSVPDVPPYETTIWVFHLPFFGKYSPIVIQFLQYLTLHHLQPPLSPPSPLPHHVLPPGRPSQSASHCHRICQCCCHQRSYRSSRYHRHGRRCCHCRRHCRWCHRHCPCCHRHQCHSRRHHCPCPCLHSTIAAAAANITTVIVAAATADVAVTALPSLEQLLPPLLLASAVTAAIALTATTCNAVS